MGFDLRLTTTRKFDLYIEQLITLFNGPIFTQWGYVRDNDRRCPVALLAYDCVRRVNYHQPDTTLGVRV